MPVYKIQSSNGRIFWRAVVYNAKLKKNETKVASSSGEAKQEETKLKIAIEKGNYNPNAYKSLLFVDVVDKVVFKKRELSVKRQVSEYFKKTKFVSIDRATIQKWVDDEIERGIKPSTAKRYFNTLRKIFREANLDQEIPIPANLFKGIKFKVENGEVFNENSLLDDSRDRIISDLEAEYLKKSIAKNNRNSILFKGIVVFMLETGIRLGESIQIKRADISLDERNIWLPPRITKTKNGRHVPITTPNLENLKQLLAMKSDSDLLFQGEWTDSNAISHRWRRHVPIAQELYLKDCANNGVIPDKSFLINCRPYDSRHTFITKLFTHTEMSVIEIALISGHKSVDMLKRYASIRGSQSRHKVW